MEDKAQELLDPDTITENTKRAVALGLLRQQIEWGSTFMKAEVNNWSTDFVSDDGQDDVTSAALIVKDLTYLAYEGSVEELKWFLFGDPEKDSPEGVHVDSVAIHSCDGLCPALNAYADAIFERSERLEGVEGVED